MGLSLFTRQYSRLKDHQLNIRPGSWVLFFALVGFGLRMQKLGFQPLWGDEGWSFYFATQTTPQLFALTAIDIHPPLYYLLLKGWLFILGRGAEEARFFSVIIGALLIPVLAVAGFRLFKHRRVAIVAAATAALMPMAIYYSQEVRMYGLVTLLGTLSVYFLARMIDQNETRPKLYLLAYLLTTVGALYTHYYAAFIVLIQSLYVLLHLLSSRTHLTRRSILRSLIPFIYVGLSYLPWIIYAGSRLASYVENKRGVEGYTPLSLSRFFGDHFIAFSLGHLSVNLEEYGWAALPVIVMALLGLLTTATLADGRLNSGRRQRHQILVYLYLFGPLLIGYLISLFYPFTPRFFERTLLLAAPAYWLLAASGLVWLWDRHYLLLGAAALPVLLVITVSLIGFYSAPRYPHEDYRPLLSEIGARATSDDVLLASYQWQLGFYEAYLPAPHPRFVAVPGWGEGWSPQAGHKEQLMADLAEILRQSPRLWFPAHQASGHIWEDEAEAAMAALGYPAMLQWYTPQTKLTLTGGIQTDLQQVSAGANFENRLVLLEAAIDKNKAYEAGREIVPIKLVWQKKNNLGSDHRVSLRLVDEASRTWTIRDSDPQAGHAFFTDMKIDDIITDHHGLLTPAGAPPGKYRLLLSVRQVLDARPLDLLDEAGQPAGVEFHLAEIELTAPDPPVGPAALPIQTTMEAVFEERVQLVGYTLGNGPFKAGESLPLTLFWQSLANEPGSLIVAVELQNEAGEAVVAYRQTPIWPAMEWQQGALLRDPHDVALPPILSPGKYHLVLRLATDEQDWLEVDGQRQLLLATVTTIGRPHIFEKPRPDIDLNINFGEQARLVGLDLPQTHLKAGDTLPLTLYWQAIAPLDNSWKVFVHLINSEGEIVSQQDQIPGAGQFPTTGWVPNEYLVDSYSLPISAERLPDKESYQLKIGLYDANDPTRRMPIMEAGQIIGDYIVLESWPISIE